MSIVPENLKGCQFFFFSLDYDCEVKNYMVEEGDSGVHDLFLMG